MNQETMEGILKRRREDEEDPARELRVRARNAEEQRHDMLLDGTRFREDMTYDEKVSFLMGMVEKYQVRLRAIETKAGHYTLEYTIPNFQCDEAAHTRIAEHFGWTCEEDLPTEHLFWNDEAHDLYQRLTLRVDNTGGTRIEVWEPRG